MIIKSEAQRAPEFVVGQDMGYIEWTTPKTLNPEEERAATITLFGCLLGGSNGID